eukprot:5589069-Amphidinium_carterae.1
MGPSSACVHPYREASYADMGKRTDVIFGNCRAYDDLSRGVLPTLAGHKVLPALVFESSLWFR